jgi:hypothetical protein
MIFINTNAIITFNTHFLQALILSSFSKALIILNQKYTIEIIAKKKAKVFKNINTWNNKFLSTFWMSSSHHWTHQRFNAVHNIHVTPKNINHQINKYMRFF